MANLLLLLFELVSCLKIDFRKS